MRGVIIDDRFKKHAAKEKAKQQKKSLADAKNQVSQPTKNG